MGGLPSINIEFKSKAVSAMQRSERGVVVILIKETTLSTIKTFRSIEQVVEKEYTPENYDYISKCFMGIPAKVVVVPIVGEGTVADALAKVKSMKWNYICMPDGVSADVTAIETFVKGARKNDKKTFKAVLANSPADDEGVINFTTEGIVVGEKTYTAQQYTCRIAGLLAGLPLSRSATYYVLPEVAEIIESATPSDDINKGKLILINDGEKIKIGRGVNSLVAMTTGKSTDWKKIKIVEAMDLIADDIRTTFNDNYIGQVVNTYANKMMFVGSCNAYFGLLEDEYVLDGSVENVCDIDVNAQETYLKSKGVDTSKMKEHELRVANTGSEVFVQAQIKPVDAVEDLKFIVNM